MSALPERARALRRLGARRRPRRRRARLRPARALRRLRAGGARGGRARGAGRARCGGSPARCPRSRRGPAGEDATGPRATPDSARTGALVSVAGDRLEADAVVLALGVSRPAPPPFAAPVADHPRLRRRSVGRARDRGLAERALGARARHRDDDGRRRAHARRRGRADASRRVSRSGELPRAHRIDPDAQGARARREPGPGLTADALASAVEAGGARGRPRLARRDRLAAPGDARAVAVARAARAGALRARVRRAAGRSTAAAGARRRGDRIARAARGRSAARGGGRGALAAPAADGRIACEVARVRQADAGHRRRRQRGRPRLGLPPRRARAAARPDRARPGRARPARARPAHGGRRRADRRRRAGPSEVLFTLGALRRGELWESVAVPELAAQACALAERVPRPRARSRPRPARAPTALCRRRGRLAVTRGVVTALACRGGGCPG